MKSVSKLGSLSRSLPQTPANMLWEENVYLSEPLLRTLKSARYRWKAKVVYLREIRWHGRGGQGAWTASELLARAAIREGKYIQSFPEFGPERMGAPVMAFTRVSDAPINLHCAIYSADLVAVLDPTLLNTVSVTDGLKKQGILVINTRETPEQLGTQLNFPKKQLRTVSATDIAVEILGRPITNTAMLGAVSKAAEIVDLNSIKEAVKERFPTKIAERNLRIVERAYHEVRSG